MSQCGSKLVSFEACKIPKKNKAILTINDEEQQHTICLNTVKLEETNATGADLKSSVLDQVPAYRDRTTSTNIVLLLYHVVDGQELLISEEESLETIMNRLNQSVPCYLKIRQK
ncbi:uncharacterized protein LOC106063847 [Biomphalaria glabrata]|uniref:Uncharacterized protein LOC106063847 n=1 Tax=Biomphalaria glabrata TaxID=6526 RepID=A0A9W2YWW0_BIOGL|nr:uncharacterized protein LOC106063847 [Biomphalaria glabrata]